MNTSSSAWDSIGWTMVHLLWVGALIGLAGALLRRLLRRRSPEARHAAALACFAGLAVAPLLLFATLYRPATGGPAGRPPVEVGQPIAADPFAPEAVPIEPERLLPWSLTAEAAGASTLAARLWPVVERLPAVWLVGSVAMLLWFVAGLIGVERMRRSCLVLDSGPLADRCRELSRSLGLARRVGVAVCDRLSTPLLVGVVRPLILVPPAAVSGWDADLLEMALLHELAHLRRHDNLINLAQRLVESFLFFHPATWWLSSWLRLERESCCDALVVSHTGRPAAYARLLAGLDPPPLPIAATAMAERPLMTRIRRIMGKEDRTMRLNLTEGLGLLAVAASLTLWAASTHARPPEDPALAVLARMADAVVVPAGAGESASGYAGALATIAEAQFARGDRAAALATLDKLDRTLKPLPTWEELTAEHDRFAEYYGRLEGVDARRKAGDVEGARAAMKRLLSIYDKIPADSCARALESLGREFLQDATEDPDRTELKVVVDQVAASLLEMEAAFIRIQVELGDLEATRALIQKGVARLDQIEDVPMASLLLAHYGGELCRAGDPETGRKLIDRGHRELLEIKDEKARPVYFRLLFTLFAHAGQIDSALALLPNLQPAWLEREMSEMIESLADPDSLGPWADFGKVSISIGDPMLELKNPAQARTTLLRIAEALGGVDNAKVRARLLAIVARLQAVAGDFDGALATANLIPELKRADYPGPRDGFYDSVRPTAFALVASQLVEAGQQDRALTTFEAALKLADAIEPVEERLIARIAIARELATCGHQAEALELAAGVVPVVSEQTEPRRSRLLGTIADVQTKAGGTDAAWSTIDRIRSWPGVEKASAVIHVAHAEEKAGHLSKADALRRRGLAALASAPAEPDPPADRVLRPTAIGRGFFLDHDTELDPGMVRYDRTRMITTIKVKLGLIDEIKADAASLNAFQKGQMLSDAATQLAWKGDYEAAMKMIESIESENGRLSAFNSIAHGLKSDTRTR